MRRRRRSLIDHPHWRPWFMYLSIGLGQLSFIVLLCVFGRGLGRSFALNVWVWIALAYMIFMLPFTIIKSIQGMDK